MKFTTKNKNLKKAISNLVRITGKNVTLPVLESILFIGSGKTLKLRATNINIGSEMEIIGTLEKEGVLAVPGAVINEFLNSIDQDEEVSLEEVNGNLNISTKHHKATVKAIPHEDFPTIPIVEGFSFSVPVNVYLEGIKSVINSAATTEIRPEISSVYMYSDENGLVFVATDSFRLSEKRIKIKIQNEINGVIIPFRNILDISRILSDYEGNIEITWNENQLSYNIENIYLTTRIINGSYPDYKQIIPKNSTTDAVFLLKDLEQSIKISNIFSDKFNQITFDVNPKNKTCFLISKNSDLGEQKTEIDCAMSGEEINISINYRYLADVLSIINADSVEFMFNGNNKPIIIKGITDNTFLYLIMPMIR